MEWQGPDSLRPLLVPLDSIKVDPANARRHPKRNIDAIRVSITQFGQRKPVVVYQGTVIAGSGTVEAMALEGWDQVAVVDSNDLTEAASRAYAIADNQTGELAEWDLEQLRETLETLPEEYALATGFTPEEREAIAALDFEGSKGGAAAEEKPEKGEQDFVSISFTKEQALVIEAAVEKMRKKENAADLTPQRVIEFLAAAYCA
jgi:hypothetical protein